MQEFCAFIDVALESFATRDESLATGALVDDSSLNCFSEVVIARRTARIDETDATHVAISHLVASEVDGVIGAKVGVHALVDLTVGRFGLLDSEVTAVVFRKLLLDDVGTDGDAEVVGLASKVSRHVVVFVLLEGVIAGVAPEYRSHALFVSHLEGLRYFDDLAVGFWGTEVNRRTDSSAAHVSGLLDSAVHHLVADVWIGEQLIMVNLNHERNLVCVAAGDAAQYTEGRTNSVTAAFDSELHDIFAVEVNRVLSERSTSGVFDALVDRENGNVASVSEATRTVEALEVSEDAVAAIRCAEGVFDPICARQVDLVFFNLRAAESEEGFCVVTEKFLDFAVLAHVLFV